MDTPGTLDTPDEGEAAGGVRRATLRWRAASLTETVCRTPFKHHGDRTRKGAP
ncbi:DUF6380 family protein [Streptomyces mutabilis]|jgi:hypothetical protein|uniref:DUF6380 family protein n=1 Tax=Streptomyces TaxID=1883 RepID=UPI000BC792D2|nr:MULTISPECIES: DUF6380 family protein [Streptomyces]MCZ9351045.1 hypothetical protein [Streptomyces mutabilis]MDN3250740.1 hypothetical protein [Streptomyces sp. ZSW22]MDN3253013.1 hypothetical protein [Streptomyces sp. MA25(2023)]MDQ0384110.1 hypothetical protein [Streptomyces sp. DSM 42143]PAK23453.1 hypothetical protein CJD44_28750 [Streptomyces sp. alain-838]